MHYPNRDRMLSHKAALVFPAFLLVLAALVCACQAANGTLFSGSEVVPSDAIVLFDGKDLSNWFKAGTDQPAGSKLENGYLEIRGGSIVSKQKFHDCQLHVEFWLPLMKDAQGQARANSGVYLQGMYEVQVLDSYGLKSKSNDCGGIYGVGAPLVNACRPPEHWQSYDILYRAPRFDVQGKQVKPGRITVLQNGVLIQDNVEISEPTAGGVKTEAGEPGPVLLQDHGNPVRYRSIWIRPLSDEK